jgi:CRP/FNR family transcriptional regulator, cyclic AMP receptor protein
MLAEPIGRHSDRDRVERELFLRSTIGRNLPSTRELAELLSDVAFEAGSSIYREGDPAEEIFFVRRGRVGLSRGGGPQRELGPGSVIGIFDVDQDQPRARTALALTDVELLSLSSEDRLELLEDSFEHTRAIIAMTAARLDEFGRYGGAPLEPGETLAPKAEALLLIERVFTLRDTPAFRRASIQALVSLAPAADELRLAAGERLFERGEARAVLYVVVAGCLELEYADGQQQRFGGASLLGGGAAFGAALSRQTARALTPAVVLRIGEEDVYDVMEDHFELARSVMSFQSSEHERWVEDSERAP